MRKHKIKSYNLCMTDLCKVQSPRRNILHISFYMDVPTYSNVCVQDSPEYWMKIRDANFAGRMWPEQGRQGNRFADYHFLGLNCSLRCLRKLQGKSIIFEIEIDVSLTARQKCFEACLISLSTWVGSTFRLLLVACRSICLPISYPSISLTLSVGPYSESLSILWCLSHHLCQCPPKAF